MNKILYIFLLIGFGINAQTYYVSSSTGSDSNNGLSEATPWKTLSKIQRSTFSPGDKVLLKRGDTWLESLEKSTGFNGVTMGAYGSGARPIISNV
jgi:hypothetical protein